MKIKQYTINNIRESILNNAQRFNKFHDLLKLEQLNEIILLPFDTPI